MSGKRAFLDLLKQEGVEIMFGNPGTTELPLMDAFATENELRYLLGLQEAAVMAMADGYAQASGKLAVVNLHVTPGQRHGHALRRAEGGLADPRHRRPARAELQRDRAHPLGGSADHCAPAGQMVVEVHRLADLPRLVHRAPRPRWRRRPGRCSCRCRATSCARTATSICSRPTRVAPRLRGDRAAVEAAAVLLAEAKRPVIMAGDAVAQSRALGSPSSRSSRRSGLYRVRAQHGVVSRLAPAVSRLDGPSRPDVRKVLDQYDVLFSVGGDLFTLSLPSDVDPMPPSSSCISTSILGARQELSAAVAILGDPKARCRTSPPPCANA